MTVPRQSRIPAPAQADASWVAGVQEGLAEREYGTSRNRNGLQAPNRAQNLRTYFTTEGVRVVRRTDDQYHWPGEIHRHQLRLARRIRRIVQVLECRIFRFVSSHHHFCRAVKAEVWKASWRLLLIWRSANS